MTLTAEQLGCPLPPPDLAACLLPVIELNLATTPLWRIHKAIYGPIHYNRKSQTNTTFRFDAAGDEFGVLYASPSFAACMTEAVVRGHFQGNSRPWMIDEHELASRCITSLGTELARPLKLADLTKPHVHLGMDNRVFSVGDYRGPNLWSTAIYQAFPDIDGIYFTSRYANEPSVAIFDRASLIAREAPIPLLRFHMLPMYLEANQIGIAPPGGNWME